MSGGKHNGQLMVNYSRVVSTIDALTKKEVSVLLALGYSNKMIRKSIRVTDFQIQKVVRETGIRRWDYRDGISPIARWVANTGRRSVTVQKYVKPKLLTQ